MERRDEDKLDDPTDPRHPDFDLSESAPFQVVETGAKPWFTRRWVLIVVGVLAIAGLLLPFLRILL